ncbi:MAG: exosortase family protein XrtG [Herpetosiphonaceae bacterium]|nr:MAG: exosortase family protein XrtG [Herpetosiphonaceae bacterium]
MSLWMLIPLFIFWLAVVVFLRAYRIWLFYYIVGAVGAAYWLALVAGDLLQLESVLAHSVALAVHAITQLFAIPTRVFNGAPGVLLVLVIRQTEASWTVLQIGVESSGLLESSVLASLLLFYPTWSLRQRGVAILIGLLATWLANILRLLVIVIILHQFGKESLVLAHTFIGKIVFFLLTIGIYRSLITLPTIRQLAQRQLRMRQPA